MGRLNAELVALSGGRAWGMDGQREIAGRMRLGGVSHLHTGSPSSFAFPACFFPPTWSVSLFPPMHPHPVFDLHLPSDFVLSLPFILFRPQHSSNSGSGPQMSGLAHALPTWPPPCISAALSTGLVTPSWTPIPSHCPTPSSWALFSSSPRLLPVVAVGADKRHGRLQHHNRLHQVCHRPPAPLWGLEPFIPSNLMRTIPPTPPFSTVDQTRALKPVDHNYLLGRA